jgi:hypothetical protein
MLWMKESGEIHMPLTAKATPESLPSPSPLYARIYTVRGRQVMLDSDLAEVYGVETRHINQAVNRNERLFPDFYSFRLTTGEWDSLRSQIVILNVGRGQHRKYLPRVFTENGAVALATVLKSDRAIAASRVVIDTFVRIRHVLDANQALARKIEELAAKVGDHDRAFAVVFEELKRLAVDIAPERPKDRIGFRSNKERGA